MYYDDFRSKREKALRLATKEMCKILESFGPTATLDFLISVSNRDYIVNELLPLFPSIASNPTLMSRIPSCKVGE